MVAAVNGHKDCLSLLIAAGCDTEAADIHGMTPAMFAARADKVDCLSMLIEAGCNIETRCNDDLTAAMYAVWSEKPNSISRLIAAGCDIESTNANGHSVANLVKWSLIGKDTTCRDIVEAEIERRKLAASTPCSAETNPRPFRV